MTGEAVVAFVCGAVGWAGNAVVGVWEERVVGAAGRKGTVGRIAWAPIAAGDVWAESVGGEVWEWDAEAVIIHEPDGFVGTPVVFMKCRTGELTFAEMVEPADEDGVERMARVDD